MYEPAVQLMTLVFFSPEDALDHAALMVLRLVKYPGRTALVWLAAVDGADSDVGGNPHPKQHPAVLVGIVSSVRVKDGPVGQQALPLHLDQHTQMETKKHRGVGKRHLERYVKFF